MTTLLIRLVLMSSPPFSTMIAARVASYKFWFSLITAFCLVTGLYLVSRPLDNLARSAGEEGFRFH